MKPIDRAMLVQVMAPVDTARGLPNDFYTDPEIFEAEKAKVFAAGWPLIGFGKDVAEPGMAKPVDFLGVPLVMVRDRDGKLRVFQNVCRHRGMVIVSEPTRLKGVLRCPYHSWCYELDGRLRSTPFFPNALLGFQNDHFFALRIEPVSVGQSFEHVEIYYADKAMTEAPFAAMRERNARLWKEVFTEDIFVVEGMQKGRTAPGFDGGKFSPAMDGPTHSFHHWVAERFVA